MKRLGSRDVAFDSFINYLPALRRSPGVTLRVCTCQPCAALMCQVSPQRDPESCPDSSGSCLGHMRYPFIRSGSAFSLNTCSWAPSSAASVTKQPERAELRARLFLPSRPIVQWHCTSRTLNIDSGPGLLNHPKD